jgi:restriction endonuclease Mrr
MKRLNSFQVGQRQYFTTEQLGLTYLKKAGLIDSPKQGIVVITKRGLEVLKKIQKLLTLNS